MHWWYLFAENEADKRRRILSLEKQEEEKTRLLILNGG